MRRIAEALEEILKVLIEIGEILSDIKNKFQPTTFTHWLELIKQKVFLFNSILARTQEEVKTQSQKGK